MQVEELVREFKYNSVSLPDPNPAFTVAQVRDFFASAYPDILNADIEGPETKNNKSVYTFRRAVGTKGGHTPAAMIADLGTLMQAGWLDSSDSNFIQDLQEKANVGEVQALSCDDSMRLIDLHRKHCSRDVHKGQAAA